MKLLILTQKVDINDNNLGFFHRWLEEFAKYCESVIVICLQKGENCLPSNVKVISLGKEGGRSRIKHLWNFYKYIFSERHNYDGVFVHMNKEYVLLGGLLWKLWHKKIALWYTHKAVSRQLKLAEKLVDKIFTASKESFRLPSKKVELVGHGILVENFSNKVVFDNQIINVKPLSEDDLYLLGVGRITPSKDWETVIRAVKELRDKNLPGLNFILFLVAGDTINQTDINHGKHLREIAHERVGSKSSIGFSFQPYPPKQMPIVYNHSHILIHTSRTGSIDKVVLEALASGRLVISSSEAFADLAKEGLIYTFPAGDYKALANKIEEIYQSGALDKIPDQRAIDYVRKNHNLDNLIKKITDFYVA